MIKKNSETRHFQVKITKERENIDSYKYEHWLYEIKKMYEETIDLSAHYRKQKIEELINERPN